MRPLILIAPFILLSCTRPAEPPGAGFARERANAGTRVIARRIGRLIAAPDFIRRYARVTGVPRRRLTRVSESGTLPCGRDSPGPCAAYGAEIRRPDRRRSE